MSYKAQDIANKILFEATNEEGGGLICNMEITENALLHAGLLSSLF